MAGVARRRRLVTRHDWLRERLDRVGVSMRTLATRLDVSPSTVLRWARRSDDDERGAGWALNRAQHGPPKVTRESIEAVLREGEG